MSIIFAVLLFSFLIFIHELGHFTAAKLSGVQVNEFSIFMGPALFKKQVGETLYSIRLIPIGGYCAMEGEDGNSENPRAFHLAAWWKRLIILVAGAFMNFVAGLIILFIVFAPAEKFAVPVIDFAEPQCTVVQENGLHVGDRILRIDGEKLYVHSNFNMLLAVNSGDSHDILVERDGKEILFKDYKLETHLFPDGNGNQVRRYGFNFALQDATFHNKLSYTWNTTLDVVRTVRLSLKMLLTGQAGLRDMAGPVGIVNMMSDTAKASPTAKDAIYNMLYFGGFIAINLAVMNMLPIPALDGGRVFFLLINTLIESITHKKLDPKYEGYIHGAGMVLLLVFMGVIMLKDIIVLFKR